MTEEGKEIGVKKNNTIINNLFTNTSLWSYGSLKLDHKWKS